MSEFQREEELLRKALQRREPRDGFAGRVLARLDEAPRQVKTPWWRWVWSPALALAMLVVLVVASAWQYHRFDAERQRRARAEKALQQLEQAMTIAAEKLEFAQAKVFQTTATEERQ